MSPLDLAILLALVCWAIYKQTRVAEVSSGPGRFTMAGIYVVLGLVLGGFDAAEGRERHRPDRPRSGAQPRRRHPPWPADPGLDGSRRRVLRQGTRVTVALFVGLVATKFALGTLAYFWHINDGAGLGEVLVMIAVMIAVQAELVSRRAAALGKARAVDGRDAGRPGRALRPEQNEVHDHDHASSPTPAAPWRRRPPPATTCC